ncbi:MAG: arsenate reductase ArsC [Phycisphaerales bacterium]|nr:arsenate reductase ArsC [Phycisphaerales bacterium]
MNTPPRVLFLCTGNSCRSQMAEGWARQLLTGVIEPSSAGIVAHGLNKHAVRAMHERGVDISMHTSKTLSELSTQAFDLVVTVCGHAHESCPVFPGNARVIHHGFDDPPKLAEGIEDHELAMEPYRRVRDEIEAFVRTIPEMIG